MLTMFLFLLDVHQVRKFERADIVLMCKERQLKTTTQKKRGKEIRKNMETNSQSPQNWSSFLRIDENKSELFHFLSSVMIDACTQEKQPLCAFDQSVFSSQNHGTCCHVQIKKLTQGCFTHKRHLKTKHKDGKIKNCGHRCSG